MGKAYDPKQGYEIAGFIWFQGYNDMVGPYPPANPQKGRRSPKDYSEYSRLLACFIRDVRKDLQAPKMPFVIGVIGIGGEENVKQESFRKAMAVPAEMPEFKGNVVAVPTAKYWDHELVEAGKKFDELNALKRFPYRVSKDGTIDKESIITPGWQAIGTPPFQTRTWHYVSYQKDPKDFYSELEEGESGDERLFKEDVPKKYEGWQQVDFDVSKWQEGLAPIGKGTFYQKGKTIIEAPEVSSEWGNGNMLLMRTSFELDSLDYEGFRLCIMADKSFNVYLNGHKIADYAWWKDHSHYRAYELTEEQKGYLQKGRNVLAIQSNCWESRGREVNWVNAMFEGLSKEGKANLDKVYESICPERDREIAKGKSNKKYHYLGSAKIYSQIGAAFARAAFAMVAFALGYSTSCTAHFPSTRY